MVSSCPRGTCPFSQPPSLHLHGRTELQGAAKAKTKAALLHCGSKWCRAPQDKERDCHLLTDVPPAKRNACVTSISLWSSNRIMGLLGPWIFPFSPYLKSVYWANICWTFALFQVLCLEQRLLQGTRQMWFLPSWNNQIIFQKLRNTVNLIY